MDEWIKRLQVGIAEIRESQARRTLLFQKRSDILWKSCFGTLQTLVPETNTTLRSSNLILRLQKSQYSTVSAWIQVDMCRLQENGSPGEIHHSIRIHATSSGMADYEPKNSSLPKINLDDLNENSIREMLYGFVMASVTAHYESPKNDPRLEEAQADR